MPPVYAIGPIPPSTSDRRTRLRLGPEPGLDRWGEAGRMFGFRPDPGLTLALGLPTLVLALPALFLGLTPGHAAALSPPKWGWPLAPTHVVRAFTAPSSTYGPGHRGVDLAGGPEAEVVSPVSGVVTYAGRLAGRPLVAIMRAGWRVDLEPVAPAVQVGDIVTRGQVVGHLVAGGHCPSSCLHWGVRNPHRVYVNPLSLLNGTVRLLPLYARSLVSIRLADAPVRMQPAIAPP